MTTEAQHKLLSIQSHLSFFNYIDDSSILKITKDVKFKRYAPSEIVFNQDSESENKIYCVLIGSVEVLIGKRDEKDKLKDIKKITELRKFKVFGEISTFAKIRRTAQIRAGKDGATLLVFSIDFEKEYDEPAFLILYKNFIKDLGSKLSVSNESFYEVISDKNKS